MRVKRQAKQRWVVVQYINESKMVHSVKKAGKTKVCSGDINESKMVHKEGRQNKGV